MRTAIIGAGGQAGVIIDILKERGEDEIVGVIDTPKEPGETVKGIPILGPFTDMVAIAKEHDIEAVVIGIGDNERRASCYAELTRLGITLINAIHPTASIAPDVTMGTGNVICRKSTICTGAVLGDDNIINTSAIVDHDTKIGSHVSINPGVKIAGKVTIGDRAFIGIGVTIIDGTSIGKGAVIGAGAVVLEDIPSGVTAVGIPCKPIKKDGKRIAEDDA